MTVTYRLPATFVRMTATRTTTRSQLRPRAATDETWDAQADLLVMADCSTHALRLDEDAFAKSGLAIEWLEDGRLAGIGLEHESGPRFAQPVIAAASAVAGLAVTAGAAPLVAAGLAGAAAVAAAGYVGGLGLSGARLNILEGEAAGLPDRTDERAAGERRPSDDDLGIHRRYREEHPAEAELLAGYRWTLLVLRTRHTELALAIVHDPGQADALHQVDRALASTQRAARDLEGHYATWIASKITTTSETLDRWYRIDVLPTDADLARELDEGSAHHTEHWWPTARDMRIMVTCDPERDAEPSTFTAATPPAGAVVRRQPIYATVAFWELRPRTEPGNEHRLTRALLRRERLLVSHPGYGTHLRQLPTGRRTAKLSMTFAPSGAVNELSAQASGQGRDRAQLVGELPALVATAGTSGKEAAETFSPAAARLAALKRQVEEREQRKLVNGLVDPGIDDLADLKAELAEAELRARLAVARATVADPTAASASFSRRLRSRDENNDDGGDG